MFIFYSLYRKFDFKCKLLHIFAFVSTNNINYSLLYVNYNYVSH